MESRKSQRESDSDGETQNSGGGMSRRRGAGIREKRKRVLSVREGEVDDFVLTSRV